MSKVTVLDKNELDPICITCKHYKKCKGYIHSEPKWCGENYVRKPE